MATNRETLEEANATELRRFNTNPANQKGNPYERYPERASWTEGRVYVRENGSKFCISRDVSRWAGSVKAYPWTKKDI